jgi:methionyl-tRNA synthetase
VNRFYISTPIYYINAEPHLGHAYTTLVADAIARAHRLMGDDVFFLTGTDEHGQKVERAAQKAGLTTNVFADQTAQKFRDILPTLNVANDDFIRTTEARHKAASQALWRRVRDRGFIYKGKYEGWYCTVDEVFVPETQLVDGRCPICGSVVERIAEESYFFKLASFQRPLLDHFRRHPDFVMPAVRRNEVISFLEAGLDDLSISRTSFAWGIPVPDDPAHVMYVWFDALTNYMTAAGHRTTLRCSGWTHSATSYFVKWSSGRMRTSPTRPSSRGTTPISPTISGISSAARPRSFSGFARIGSRRRTPSFARASQNTICVPTPTTWSAV